MLQRKLQKLKTAKPHMKGVVIGVAQMSTAPPAEKAIKASNDNLFYQQRSVQPLKPYLAVEEACGECQYYGEGQADGQCLKRHQEKISRLPRQNQAESGQHQYGKGERLWEVCEYGMDIQGHYKPAQITQVIRVGLELARRHTASLAFIFQSIFFYDKLYKQLLGHTLPPFRCM